MATRPDQPAPAAPGPSRGALPFVAMIAGNALLALGPWSVRLADVGPVASGFWRVTLALPFLLAIAWRSGPVPRGAWRRMTIVLLLAFAGLCFALDLASWHAGILRTRLANATLFGNAASFFFVIYGFLIARRVPSGMQLAALLLAAAGVALLMGRSFELSPEHILGDLLCLAAGLFYTGYLIAVERVRGTLGTWPLLAAATVFAAAALLPLALVAGDALVPHRWWPLLALAIGSQVLGQGLLVYVLGALPPTVVGLGLLTQPVVAAAVGWLAYRERLTPGDLIGAAAVAVALVLIRRRA